MNSSKRLARHIIPYSGSIMIAIACTLLIALCEMGYVSMLSDTIDAINVIGKGLPAKISFFAKFAKIANFSGDSAGSDADGLEIQLTDSNDAIEFVTYVALSILAIIVFKGVLSFATTYIISRVGQKLILNLRRELYDKLVHFPLGFFCREARMRYYVARN